MHREIGRNAYIVLEFSVLDIGCVFVVSPTVMDASLHLSRHVGASAGVAYLYVYTYVFFSLLSIFYLIICGACLLLLFFFSKGVQPFLSLVDARSNEVYFLAK